MAILLPDFAPDRSLYALDAASVIINALPILDRYGPFPDLTIVADALPAAAAGAISVRSNVFTTWGTFAGTRAKLYKLNTGTSPYSWTDYTRLAGGDYGVPSTDRWSFCPVGSRLLAANITDAVQYLDVDSGVNFAALPGSPPKAKFVWTVSEFVVLGYLEGMPNFIQWSAYGDSEQWTRGLGGAWRQELPSGGEVMGGFGDEEGATIFQRQQIRRMSFSLDAAGFDVHVINQARGTVAPYGVVPIGPSEWFYPSDDGFYIFNGVEDYPIGYERVDRWFFGDDSTGLISEVDRENLGAIRAFHDPFRKVVILQYPKTDGSYGLIGLAYRAVGQDGRPGRWFVLDFSIEEIVALATAGVTIDGLANLYASIDAIDQPFDSRLFSGGKPTIGGFNSDHELGYFTGNNLAATLEHPKMQLSPGYRSLLREVAVLGDIDPTDITIQVGSTETRGGATTWGSAISAENDGSGAFKPLVDAKFRQVRYNIPAGTDWRSIAGMDDAESQWNQTGKT